MNHQPFETWILNDAMELSQDQTFELKRHLESCRDCQQLYQNWQTARSFLTISSSVSPLPGFTMRWQNSLAIRQAAQRKRQIRKIFSFLILGILITSLMLFLYANTYLGLSNVLVTMIKELAILSLSFAKITLIARSLMNVLPPIIPIGAWILSTTTFTALTAAWLVAIWQVAIKGVENP